MEEVEERDNIINETGAFFSLFLLFHYFRVPLSVAGVCAILLSFSHSISHCCLKPASSTNRRIGRGEQHLCLFPHWRLALLCLPAYQFVGFFFVLCVFLFIFFSSSSLLLLLLLPVHSPHPNPTISLLVADPVLPFSCSFLFILVDSCSLLFTFVHLLLTLSLAFPFVIAPSLHHTPDSVPLLAGHLTLIVIPTYSCSSSSISFSSSHPSHPSPSFANTRNVLLIPVPESVTNKV